LDDATKKIVTEFNVMKMPGKKIPERIYN